MGTHSGHHVMNIQSVKDLEHYDSYGQLSHAGTHEYWRALNGIFKDFDHHEISLKPPKTGSGKRLPTPPTQLQDTKPKCSSSASTPLRNKENHPRNHNRYEC